MAILGAGHMPGLETPDPVNDATVGLLEERHRDER
jgi:hypothetical protein